MDDQCGWKRCRQPGNCCSIVGAKSRRTYDLCPKHYLVLAKRDDVPMCEQVELEAKPRPEPSLPKTIKRRRKNEN